MHYYLDLKKNKEGKHLLHSDYCIESCSSYKKIGHSRDLKEYKSRQEALASAKSIYSAWGDMITFCDSELKNISNDEVKVTDYINESKCKKKISEENKVPLGCWSIIIVFVIIILAAAFAEQTKTPLLTDNSQGGSAVHVLGKFINGVLSFITAILWGVWVIYSALFAKDLMMGVESEKLHGKAIKLGAAALILVSITALPALFAGLAN